MNEPSKIKCIRASNACQTNRKRQRVAMLDGNTTRERASAAMRIATVERREKRVVESRVGSEGSVYVILV